MKYSDATTVDIINHFYSVLGIGSLRCCENVYPMVLCSNIILLHFNPAQYKLYDTFSMKAEFEPSDVIM
jgi:hypothetical protein